MISVPAPRIFAPIVFRKLARSTISGSFATFSRIVWPLARAAAIMMFSVAPTLGKSRYILEPLRRLHDPLIKPCSNLILAPKASNPLICKSIGRLPILHPPGSAISALWNLASNGPNNRFEALSFFTSLYGVFVSTLSGVLIVTLSLPVFCILTPKSAIMSSNTSTSVM